MVVYPRKSGRVWVEPAAGRVLAGRGGMGRPPRRFPRANGLFCTPHSDHRATAKTMDAMDEQPLHLQRDMTHDAFRRYLEARTELAELASVLIVAAWTATRSSWPRGPRYGRFEGRGGMASSLQRSFFA